MSNNILSTERQKNIQETINKYQTKNKDASFQLSLIDSRQEDFNEKIEKSNKALEKFSHNTKVDLGGIGLFAVAGGLLATLVSPLTLIASVPAVLHFSVNAILNNVRYKKQKKEHEEILSNYKDYCQSRKELEQEIERSQECIDFYTKVKDNKITVQEIEEFLTKYSTEELNVNDIQIINESLAYVQESQKIQDSIKTPVEEINETEMIRN